MKLLEKIKEDASKVPKTLIWKINNRKLTLEDEEEVLASGNTLIAYWFARDVPGANIGRLEDIVIQDPKWSYYFVNDVPGVNISRFEDIVVQFPKWSYWFAKDVKGSNIGRLKKVYNGKY
jgi:hypothetical protein